VINISFNYVQKGIKAFAKYNPLWHGWSTLTTEAEWRMHQALYSNTLHKSWHIPLHCRLLGNHFLHPSQSVLPYPCQLTCQCRHDRHHLQKNNCNSRKVSIQWTIQIRVNVEGFKWNLPAWPRTGIFVDALIWETSLLLPLGMTRSMTSSSCTVY
jgi:hypothetical protein